MPVEAAAVNESLAAAGAEQEQQQATTTTSESATEGQEQQEGAQTEGEQKPKVTGGFQKRIDKLTREREQLRELLIQEMARRGGQQQESTQQTETANPAAEAKPKASDFETHEQYVEALVDWKADQKLKAADAQRATERTRAEQHSAEQAYQQREREYAGAVPDFEEVVAAADFPVSKAVVQEIVHGENGPALKYYLATHPEEAERLNKMTPLALAREVGRLEPKLKPAGRGQAKAAPVVSKAPQPPTPAGRTASTSTKDPGEMSPAEYRAWRAKTYPNLR